MLITCKIELGALLKLLARKNCQETTELSDLPSSELHMPTIPHNYSIAGRQSIYAVHSRISRQIYMHFVVEYDLKASSQGKKDVKQFLFLQKEQKLPNSQPHNCFNTNFVYVIDALNIATKDISCSMNDFESICNRHFRIRT